MIISPLHKYVFVELPHTATTSIRRELCSIYDGQEILAKHSPYHKFLKTANAEQKQYFVFSSLRNPLDVVVTKYLKIKTNHNGGYTKPEHWQRNGAWIPDYELKQFKFVQDNDADFPTFFKKYYKFPYDNWSCLDHKQFDFVMRYENVQDDFSKAIQLIGMEQKRPLPVVNKTREKKDFISYYTPEIQEQAKRIFGPFMKKWGYEIPREWGDSSDLGTSELQLNLANIPRKLYWMYWKKY